MEYVIANIDNTKYVSQDNLGRYGWCTSINYANKFTDKDKVNNVIKNNLTKLGDEFNVIEIKEPKINYMIDSIENFADRDYEEYTDMPLSTDLSTILDILNDLPNKLLNNKKKALNDLSRVSKALTDTQHYKEFRPKRSASAKCKLDTFETKCLAKRREIKDTLRQIECAEKRLKGEMININLEDRVYVPRVLGDLFNTDEVPNFEEWWGE